VWHVVLFVEKKGEKKREKIRERKKERDNLVGCLASWPTRSCYPMGDQQGCLGRA